MIELKETQSDIFSIYGAQKIEKDEINKLITNIENQNLSHRKNCSLHSILAKRNDDIIFESKKPSQEPI